MANKKLNGKAFALNSIDPVKLDSRSSVGQFLAFNASGVLAPHVGMNVDGTVVQFNQDLIISGNLTVQGGTVSVDSTDASIADGMVVINSNATSGSVDGGIEVNRGDGNTSSKLYFSESTEDKFALKKGEDATEYIIANLEDANTADIALNSSLTGETARAMGIESGLTQDIIDEGSARAANDAVLTGMLSTQLSNFTGSLATHNGNISGAVSASKAAEVILSGSVDTEISREEGQITTLTGLLSTEDGRQNGAMSGLEGDLATEISREQAAMSGLEGNLASEISREGGEISNLTNDLTVENTAATTKEAQIQTQIASFNADIAAETVRATNATIALQAKFDAAFTKMGVGSTFDPSYMIAQMDDLIANGGTEVATRLATMKATFTAAGMYTSNSEVANLDNLGEYKYLKDRVYSFKSKEMMNTNEGQITHTCKAEFTYAGATLTSGTLTIASPADVNVADYSGYGDIVVSCNGLPLPDDAVTFTITPGVKRSDANNQHLWATAPIITEVKILVDQIQYEIEAGDFFIIKYDRLELHTDGAAKWNDHDETPYCCDSEGTNYVAGANVCDNNTCNYSLSCSDTSITFTLHDSYGDGGQGARLFEADGVTEKVWMSSGINYFTNATESTEDIFCMVEGTTYVLETVDTDSYSGGYYAEGSVTFKNASGEVLPQNGIDLSVDGAAFTGTFGTSLKHNVVLDAGGTSVTVSLFV